jgi:ribose transport system ATP-binding protein
LSAASPGSAPCLVATDLTKSFSGNIALNSFSIEIMPGQVHAIVGHNGSGKSTFIKMLAGYYVPDSGTVVVLGHPLRPGDPASSSGAGLSFVHQTLGLVPSLSVLENLHFGKPYHVNVAGKINWKRERAVAAEALLRFGLSVDPRVPVSRLSTVERVELAIVRALGGGAMTVLVLDEPTAALTDQEVNRLFATIRRVTAEGVAVIYISHRLEEIPQIADVITVLSDGRILDRGPVSEFGVPRLVSLISGAAEGSVSARPTTVGSWLERSDSEPVLRLEHVTGKVLREFCLEGHPGEITGVVGLLGSGVEELVGIMSGRQHPTSGRLELSGRSVPLGSLAELAARGLRVVVGDKAERIVPELTVGENATLSIVSRYYLRGVLRLRALRRRAKQILGDVRVVPADPNLRAGALSGGNQQKLALARILQAEPAVIVLEEPFHGVDVRGRADLSEMLRAECRKGRMVLIVDSDLDEITNIATRITVLRDGRTVLVADRQDVDKHRLLEACYGGRGQDQ